jgi:uncharacterized membrane protein
MNSAMNRLSPFPFDTTLLTLLVAYVMFGVSLGVSWKLALLFPSAYAAFMLLLITLDFVNSRLHKERSHVRTRLLFLLATLSPVIAYAWTHLPE